MIWTEEKNTERCRLIDKEIDGTLTDPWDKALLIVLQREMLEYRNSKSPFPLVELRELHQSLKAFEGKASNEH